ncbi:Membrane protein involved in the export of O-antigen and teichoic acid [Mesonia phycicola]|uniref:Membrane protein involved in the export of O-antigen and teichoic acid n=1 Tax=Mesonia phycicola TaxID=579105 RepID=A0A1M6H2B3_9FLAO|nr:oligosaccharide flippase family protein [Mesonia phycicola]SHJ16338.1 Membrane protein involved in the export of O-antigen and teichoic acid [Mesonia phycicola]
MNQFKTGALISYLSIFVTNISGLLLTPYIIRRLGTSEYGVYVLVGSIIAYLSVLDFGLNNAVAKYVTKYRLKSEKESEANFLGLISLNFLGLLIIISIIGVLICLNFENFFSKNLTVKEIELGSKLVPLVIFNVILVLPSSILTAYCHAYNKFVFPKITMLLKTILRAAFVFFFLYIGFKAVAIVLIDTFFNLLMTASLLFFCLQRIKVKVKFSKIDFKLWHEILYYSFWIFLASLVLKFQWQGGQAIAGRQLGASSVAVFAIGIMLGGYYNAFAFAINSMILPRAVNMIEQKKNSVEITNDMVKIARYILMILLLILSGFFLFGQLFIKLWVGDFYLPAWYIAILFMLVRTIPIIQVYGRSILEAKNKNRYKSLLNFVTASLALIIAYFLAPVYGLKAIYMSILIAMVIDSILMNLYYKKVFDFLIWRFFRESFLPFIIVTLFLGSFFYFIMDLCYLNSWVDLLMFTIIYGISYVLIIYNLLLSNEEKHTLLSLFNIKIK